MKSFTKYLAFAVSALSLGVFASCSNDLEPSADVQSPVAGNQDLLVRQPEVTAWSGEHVFGTLTTRAEEIADVTNEEIAAAKNYFNAKDNYYPATGGTDCEELPSWTNYYVQEVVSGNQIPLEVAQIIGTNNETISNIAVWSIDADEVVKILNTDDYVTSEAKKSLGDLTEATLVSNHALKDISFETTGYDINNIPYQKKTSGHFGSYDWQPNYRIATLEGQEDCIYVALYGYTNSNNGFWDRIIKITKITYVEAETPEIKEDSDVIADESILHNNEVEVNLSILDTHRYNSVEDLISKLSIHVRYAHDVKVYIPVPYETLVPADDLDIVLSHKELREKFGENHRASFEINGHEVTLNVQYTEANDCAGNGYGYYIEVSTNGINKDVFDFCWSTYGDGVNFEVYNYYQWNVIGEDGEPVRTKPTPEDIAALQSNWLNKTTVEFGYYSGDNWNIYTSSSDYPYYFINSFSTNPDNYDCLVKINSNTAAFFEHLYQGEHLNGSNFNYIYVRNDIFGTDKHDEAHKPSGDTAL